jgi:flagellin-like protein
LKLFRGKKRVAINELIGTLIMVAITLIAGAAVFGFVNGQAGTSENQYAQSAANNVNYLKEHFVIVNVQFTSADCTGTSPNRYCSQISISLYNNGNVALTLKQLSITNTGTTSAGGTTVPTLTATVGETQTTVSLSSGATTYCTSTSSNAQSSNANAVLGSSTVAQSAVPPASYTITLSSAYFSCLSAAPGVFLVGANYQVQGLGAYGSVVTTQITANG